MRQDERRETSHYTATTSAWPHQCKYLGLPENVRVRRAGFAYRTEYHRFLERFKTLSRATYPREWTGTDQNGAREIVKAASKLGGVLSSLADGSETQFGRHKLFVKAARSVCSARKGKGREIRVLRAYAAKIAKDRSPRWSSRSLRESVLLSRDVSPEGSASIGEACCYLGLDGSRGSTV